MKNPQNTTSTKKSPTFFDKIKKGLRSFGENLRKNLNILRELTRKAVKTQYRGSVLGMLWTLLNPLLNMLVMWLVFSQFFGRNDPVFPIYLLTGNILFASLRSSTDGALGSVVANRGLLLRIKINPVLFPLSSITSSLVSFGFSFIALLLIMGGMQLWGGHDLFGWQMVFVLAMLPALIMFESGVGLFLSALYVYGRDIKHFYHVFLTLWMYLTPIFYKVTMFKEGSFAFTVVKLNPMYHFVKFFRESVYLAHYEQPPRFAEEALETLLEYHPLGLPSMITLSRIYICGAATCLIGLGLFLLLKRRFMTHL